MNPMEPIKVFAERRTSRLQYVLKTVFEERMGLKASLTANRQEFEQFHGLRLNYSNISIPGPVQIRPVSLLFEKRLQEQQVQVAQGDVPLLFQHTGNELGHDPLAAVFYLLSRFEEYFPYRQDEHGRFPSTEGIAHKYNAARLPLADIYIERLRDFLLQYHPSLKVTRPRFKLEVSVDVDQMFIYRARGIARSMAGMLRDLVTDFESFQKRINVITGQMKDPLDIYDDILSACNSTGHTPLFFFQVGETSRYDVNNPIHLPFIKNKINDIAMEAKVGIHPSYFTSERPGMLELECDRLRSVTSVTIERSRQHYLRFRLPATFRKLEDLGVRDDYSMGFPDINGFRASTSVPFHFFDLERDEATGIRIHPLIFMDILAMRQHESARDVLKEARVLMNTVKKFGGVFSTVWHPEALIGLNLPFGSKSVLETILDEARAYRTA